jgi:hypothetical protein
MERERERQGGRGRWGRAMLTLLAALFFQTEIGPGHVAAADYHITTAQVHLTRDLFPDAAGGAGYLLVR